MDNVESAKTLIGLLDLTTLNDNDNNETIENLCKKMIDAVATYGDGAVAYASKAFATKATTRLMDKVGMWFDAVSGGELHLLLTSGVNPKHIIFHGNAKTEREIRILQEIQY